MSKFNRLYSVFGLLTLLTLGHSDTLQGQSLSVSPSPLAFTAQQGGSVPAAQVLTIATTHPFLVDEAMVGGGAWLLPSLKSGDATTTQINVFVNPGSLTQGTYNGTLTFRHSPATIAPNVVVSVTLTIGTPAASLIPTPTGFAFAYQLGGATPASQSLTIASSGAAFNYTAAAVLTSGSWLQVSPTSGTTGTGQVNVNIATSGLTVGTYQGIVRITAAGASNSPLDVPVTLTVSGNPTLTAAPGSFTFYHQVGSSTLPQQQTLNLSSSGAALNFTATAASGGGWLVVTPASGTTNAALGVSVNTTGLGAGTYGGTITIAAAGASNPNQTIPVTLVVSTNPLLIPSPASLAFTYQIGASSPAGQTVTLSTTGANIPFTVETTSTGGWLTAGPSNGTAPGTITVGVQPTNLAPGTYTGTVTLTAATAGNSPQTVQVSLTVTNNPLLSLSPAALSFAFQTGATAPPNQLVQVTSTGAPLTFAATASAAGGLTWLSVSPASGTSGSALTVGVNTAGLAVGSYDGTVTVTAVGAGNSPRTLPVRLVVSDTALLVLSPGALNFSVAAGSTAPQADQASVTSTNSSSLNFTVSSSTSTGGNWLTVGPSSAATPTSLQVAAIPGGLQVGTYTGSVEITSPGVANSPQVLVVNLRITPTATMTVAPQTLSFTQVGSSVPAAQTLNVTSSSGVLNVASAVSAGASWLTVNPASASTPGAFTVTASGAGLVPGTYNATISITSSGAANSPVNIPVTLTVTATQTISATPASLTFNHQAGAAQGPAQQTLALALNAGTANFTAAASSTGNWLSLTPANGALPGNVTVSAAPGTLSPGSYQGAITVTVAGASNSPLVVPVALVISGNVLTATPNALTFTYQAGSAQPANQTVNVASTLPVTITASVSSASGGNWLSVSPASGTTPLALTVSVNPANLAPATYTGTINIVSPGTNAAQVSVSLIVGTPPVSPNVAAVVNGASQQVADLSAGLIFTLYGTSIGPPVPVLLKLTGGRVDTNIGNTRVLLDGIEAPMVYASTNQTSAIVPYELANRTSARLQVEYLGVRSPAVDLRISPASPGIFTLDSTGTGPGAILNQNNTVNRPNNPERRGNVIAIYATGEGQTSPPGQNGTLNSVLREPLQSVTVTIGGQSARVTYAGAAPGLVAGVMQVNAVIPDGVASGSQLVVIRVGSTPSQSGVTVAVQ